MNNEQDEPDESEYDADNVKINVDQHSYGEQSITDDSDNVSKDCEQEITKAREILEQSNSTMKESYNEPDQSATSQSDMPQREARQQIQSSREMVARTISQSQSHMISFGCLNDTSQSLTMLAGP